MALFPEHLIKDIDKYKPHPTIPGTAVDEEGNHYYGAWQSNKPVGSTYFLPKSGIYELVHPFNRGATFPKIPSLERDAFKPNINAECYPPFPEVRLNQLPSYVATLRVRKVVPRIIFSYTKRFGDSMWPLYHAVFLSSAVFYLFRLGQRHPAQQTPVAEF